MHFNIESNTYYVLCTLETKKSHAICKSKALCLWWNESQRWFFSDKIKYFKCCCLLYVRLWRGNRTAASCESVHSPLPARAGLPVWHQDIDKSTVKGLGITRDLKVWGSFIPVTDRTKENSLVCLSDPRLGSRRITVRKKSCSLLLLWSHLIRQALLGNYVRCFESEFMP